MATLRESRAYRVAPSILWAPHTAYPSALRILADCRNGASADGLCRLTLGCAIIADMTDTTDDASHNTTDVSHDTTVDVTTAAELLGISEEAVRARIRRGKLVAEKVGALWRVHLSSGEHVITPNTTVPSRDTTSRPITEHVAQHDTTPRDMDLEPLAAVIRDQNHRIEELAAAAAFWQVRAHQAEEQLKSLTSGETPPETAPEAVESPQTNETEPQGFWDRVRRFWSG